MYAMKSIDYSKFFDCHETSCGYMEPHKHGFACDKTCGVCHGHYDKENE